MTQYHTVTQLENVHSHLDRLNTAMELSIVAEGSSIAGKVFSTEASCSAKRIKLLMSLEAKYHLENSSEITCRTHPNATYTQEMRARAIKFARLLRTAEIQGDSLFFRIIQSQAKKSGSNDLCDLCAQVIYRNLLHSETLQLEVYDSLHK